MFVLVVAGITNGLVGVILLALLVAERLRDRSRRRYPRPAPEPPQTCTRPPPHECRVNGPCNGWPRDVPRIVEDVALEVEREPEGGNEAP